MKKYHIWFNSQCLLSIEAKDNKEARKEFNKLISVREEFIID